MKKEIAFIDGKEVEVVIKIDDYEYENDLVNAINLEDTLDLTELLDSTMQINIEDLND